MDEIYREEELNKEIKALENTLEDKYNEKYNIRKEDSSKQILCN